MDMFFICKDALEDSVIGNLGMAMEAKKEGYDVGVLFTEEALAAFGGGSFRWSPLFENRDTVIKISRNATGMRIQVASEKDDRWTDISRLLKAANEAGVKLMACPIWSQILDLNGKIPPEITATDATTLFKEMINAKKIIGGV